MENIQINAPFEKKLQQGRKTRKAPTSAKAVEKLIFKLKSKLERTKVLVTSELSTTNIDF